jgi:hypothetical protein
VPSRVPPLLRHCTFTIAAYIVAVDCDSAAARGCTGGGDDVNEWARPETSAAGFHFVPSTPEACRHPAKSAQADGGLRRYCKVEPPSPSIPRDRSKISTTREKGPGSSGAPGSCAFRPDDASICRHKLIPTDPGRDDFRGDHVVHRPEDFDDLVA